MGVSLSFPIRKRVHIEYFKIYYIKKKTVDDENDSLLVQVKSQIKKNEDFFWKRLSNRKRGAQFWAAKSALWP